MKYILQAILEASETNELSCSLHENEELKGLPLETKADFLGIMLSYMEGSSINREEPKTYFPKELAGEVVSLELNYDDEHGYKFKVIVPDSIKQSQGDNEVKAFHVVLESLQKLEGELLAVQ